MTIYPCVVYWIHLKDHTNILTEGYLGVSNEPDIRKRNHFRYLNENTHCNTKLQNAVNKYGIENIVMSIILVADTNYCYELEKKLRPENGIGWNIAAGGNGGKLFDRENDPRVGKPSWNSGKTKHDTPALAESGKKVSLALKGRKNEPCSEQKKQTISNTKNSLEWKESVGYESTRKMKETKNSLEWKETVGKEVSRKQSVIRNNIEWIETIGKDSKKKEMETKSSLEWKETIGNEQIVKQKQTKSNPQWLENNSTVCEHCNKKVAKWIYTRYHGDKCKMKQSGQCNPC
jgi:hypothetical protein